MAGINYRRVVVGGLLGGVVANVCDAVFNMYLLAAEMEDMAQRLGLDLTTINGMSVAVSWVVVDFVYATLIVWTYAAVRPRLGPGPKTAIAAGLVIFLAVTVVLFGFTQMGIFTMPTFIKASGLSAVTAVLTSLAGAWAYREG